MTRIITSRRFIASFVTLITLLAAIPAFSLQPPSPGEIEQLKKTGEFTARKEQAKAFGNHLIDPYLLEKALNKAKRAALLQQGFTPAMIDQSTPIYAPPPAWSGTPTTGNVKFFALLIDFSDYPASNTQASIHSALFGNGSAIPSNVAPLESLANYYARSSYNLLNLSNGVTLGWYRPAYTRASMPQTTAAREQLIKDAINSFNGAVDFSQFDNNGDGTIEYFPVIWTGPDNGWANFWWGYQTSFSDSTFTVDGKKLGKYSWQWEYNNGGYTGPFSPQTVIHETGHALGLPDYYDYDASVGPKGGVGGLDMMHGNWGDHNSFSKWILEWITPTIVASGSLNKTLNPSGTSTDAVLVMPAATASDPFREFYIAQNRYRVGNDKGYPADGMLIWHVDARLDGSGYDYLYNNSYTSHKLLKLMQADGLDRIENSSAWADAAMYYVPGKTLTPGSNPSSKDYTGIDTRVNVTGITQTVQQMNATFSIDATSTMRTLTVAKTGNGSGAVTNTAGGISCGSDCGESFPTSTLVTLNAVAAPGCVFTGWTGGGCSGTGSCVVTMSSDTAVSANFTTTIILFEDFNTRTMPTGWSKQDNASGGDWWFIDSSDFGIANSTGGVGGYTIGASYGAGNPGFDIELRTIPINLTPYSNVGLEFKTDAGTLTADVDVSLNGVTGPWTNVWRNNPLVPGPATVNIDLSASAAGASSVTLRFRHYGSRVWWLLDDVKVMASGVVPLSAPVLAAEPAVTPGTTNTISWGAVLAISGVPLPAEVPVAIQALSTGFGIDLYTAGRVNYGFVIKDTSEIVLAGPGPTLTPYQPSGWSDKIVVSNGTGTNIDSSPLYPTDTLYIDWAVANFGDSATATTYYTELYVDNILKATWSTPSPMNFNTYSGVTDYSIGTLTAGTHTIRIKTDSTGVITESNESDNEYTKTITITAAIPNLIPYQPSGWTDKIVVSKGTGTTIDSNPLYTTDTLYVDWAVINNGGSATAATFYSELYVDNVLKNTWYSDPPLNSNYYINVLDYSIGTLTAGTHTIRIKTDSTGTITESNESDNEYTKTITVVAMEYYAECANNAGFTSPINSGWTTQTQWTFSSLTVGQTYWYRVKARLGAQESGWSNVVYSLQASPPDGPTITSAKAGNSKASIYLSPGANGGSPITGYTVTSSLGTTSPSLTLPIIVSGLTNGISYSFTAKAINAAGSSLDSTPFVSAVIPGLVRNYGYDATGYVTLQAAYNANTPTTEFQIVGGALVGGLLKSDANTVTIKGGYDADFAYSVGAPSVLGTVQLKSGKTNFQNIIIK